MDGRKQKKVKIACPSCGSTYTYAKPSIKKVVVTDGVESNLMGYACRTCGEDFHGKYIKDILAERTVMVNNTSEILKDPERRKELIANLASKIGGKK